MGILSIVILGLLIFVHELGHFLVAKYNKVGVAEFAVGFGPKLFSKVFGSTRYSLRAIPLGGYVRMVGETPMAAKEALMEGAPAVEPHEQELLKDQSCWFVTKKLSARAAVVFAGPLFNLIFAYVLAVVAISTWGVMKPSETSTVIGELAPEYPAEKAGMKVGDKVLEINGTPITLWRQIRENVEANKDGPLIFKIQRNDQVLEFDLRSKELAPEVDYLLGSGEGKKTYMVGISQDAERVKVDPVSALWQGGVYVGYLTWMNLKSIYGLIKGIVSPSNLGGPIAIIKEAAKSASSGLERTFGFMIFLNVGLAVLNLLPIPVLDGGHLTFYLLEAIRGKPLAVKVQDYATRIGMLALLTLMVYALSNDIRNLF
jgi:regulator of sigma E protease